VDAGFLAALTPAQLPELLPGYLASFYEDPAAAARCRAEIAARIAGAAEADWAQLLAELYVLGDAQRVYRANPLGRVISRAWCVEAVTHWEVTGIDHLRGAVAAGPTVLVGNHTSYLDTSATDAILAWAGHDDLAQRLLAIAGPKVYGQLLRRVASAALHTLPVPQSTAIAHAEPLPVRELARRAMASLEAASEACRAGDVPLLYPEGSRTRTGRLGSFLRATHRYLDLADGLSVVPVAIVGAREVMATGVERVRPGSIAVRFGPPLPPSLPARARLEAAHAAVADLLPEDYRPAADTPPVA
jgi:1-acyl-sn-glycerol-3-phosphate acyltransferase